MLRFSISFLMLAIAAISTGCSNQIQIPRDRPPIAPEVPTGTQEFRIPAGYKVNGKAATKEEYDRAFKKDPASAEICSKGVQTGKVLCAGG